MRTVTCTDCGCEFPMGQTLLLSGQTLCRPCLEARWRAANGHLPEPPHKAVDPTVCIKCGTDHGEIELPLVAGMPLCDGCYQKAHNPTFPTWVKASVAAVLALAGFSLAHNWRFFQAYVESERGKREAKAGHYHQAHDLLASASRRVPESPKLAFGARLYAAYAAVDDGDFEQGHRIMADLDREHPEDALVARQARELSAALHIQQARQASKQQEHARAVALMDQAISECPDPAFQLERDIYQVCHLMDEERDGEALTLARALRDKGSQDKELQEAINALIGVAERGDAFDRKDYDAFLAKARELEAERPDNPGAVAQVASALACKYAATGQEKYKAEALKALEKARALPGTRDEEFKEYEERILYRLRTREIISTKEYSRRFPSTTSAPATVPTGTQEGGS